MASEMSFYRSRILPRAMNAMMSSDENRAIRSRVCAGLDGTVVEIGFGSGLNVPFYPASVHTVHAVEPASRSVALAAERIEASHAHVDHKVARRQRRIEPISKPIFGGCHLTRDIPAVLGRAGFVIDTMTTYRHAKEPTAFGWTFEGRAAPV